MHSDTTLVALHTQNVDSKSLSDAELSHESQYLIFQLQGALYALDALAVREIHLLPEITPLAESAPYVVGIINLRGHIVPVMELALRLGQPPQPCSLNDCMVVLQKEDTFLAVIVNEVRNVQPILEEQIEAVPLPDKTASAPFVIGVAKVQEEVVMLLSLDNLLHLPHSGATSLGALPGEKSVETLTAPRFSVNHFTLDERAVLHERARRLMPNTQTQSSGDLAPVALVQLHGECYGIDLQSVREFCELRQVSPVPCCPAHIIGQMNLRGDIMTLIDIQPLLQMPMRDATQKSSVVVVQNDHAPVGIMVDEVLDILYVSDQELEEPSALQTAGSKYFGGSVLRSDKQICILDLPKILAEEGLVVDEAVL